MVLQSARNEEIGAEGRGLIEVHKFKLIPSWKAFHCERGILHAKAE